MAKNDKANVSAYANKIFDMFKIEAGPLTDDDMMDVIKIENLLIEYGNTIRLEKGGSSNGKLSDPISVVTFKSTCNWTDVPSYQVWKRSDQKIVTNVFLSQQNDPSMDDSSYIKIVYTCQTILDELNEQKLRKKLQKDMSDCEIIAIEQYERSLISGLPMFNNFSNQTK